ncbi:MAG: hypothetical protein SWX82_28555 [Cyanobacteriota bacterium]|nr:hypothetical protein [Cyanobacteriota bacterium]
MDIYFIYEFTKEEEELIWIDIKATNAAYKNSNPDCHFTIAFSTPSAIAFFFIMLLFILISFYAERITYSQYTSKIVREQKSCIYYISRVIAFILKLLIEA